MIKKIKYIIIPIILVVLMLFSSKVLAGYKIDIYTPPSYYNTAAYSALYHNGNLLSYTYDPDGTGPNYLLGLIGIGKDETKEARKEFVNEDIENLLGARLRLGPDDYLEARRSLCLNHQQGNYGVNGYYDINYILDLDFDQNGKMIYKYYAKNSEPQYTNSEYASILNAMIYVNGKYMDDYSEYKHELDTEWFNFANANNTIIPASFISYTNQLGQTEHHVYDGGVFYENEDAMNLLNDQCTKYDAFIKIKKLDVENENHEMIEPKEIESVNINGDNCIVIGPFCMDFNEENGIKNEQRGF